MNRGKTIRLSLLLTLLTGTAGYGWWHQLQQPAIGQSVVSIQEPRLAPEQTGRLLSSGNFIHANPQDRTHYGSGQARVFEHVVRLEEDFMVGPGPAYYLYLTESTDFKPGTDLKTVEHVELGNLKAFQGAQNYPIPASTDAAQYSSLVVWCKLFGILISPARLTPAPTVH